MPQTDTMDIRPMSADNLEEILQIERDSFASPWSREGFLQELDQTGHSCSIVAMNDVSVIGYAVAWFVADELYIANIAVRRDHRRQGIGRKLLQNLLDRGMTRGCQLATLEVRQSNRAAIELYTGFGFLAIALRKRYYLDTGEDAVVMLKNLEGKGEVEMSKKGG